jgi:hypothetical protein
VPNYAEVWYKNLYDGIDLRYYTNEKGLKYDFIVSPGADVENIRLKYIGAEKLEIDNRGNLIIKTLIKDLKDNDLYIYQNEDGFQQKIKGKFVKYDEFEYGFSVESFYNREKPIIIDPVIKLGFSTYFGGSSDDQGRSLGTDSFGNIYLTGTTVSPDFPKTPGANDTSYNGNGDIFIAKFNRTGSKLIYSTFIGGNNQEQTKNLAIDSKGKGYITGQTFSSNFPTTISTFDKQLNGTCDIFVLKLNSMGSDLIYSTFIGGDSHEYGWDIAIDLNGHAFVTGNTNSTNFPITDSAFDKQLNGIINIFVLKLNSTGSGLIYSTFVGGTLSDQAAGIALDSVGNAYITGLAGSKDFPTTPGAFDRSKDSDNPCVLVFKLNYNGSNLIYSTYVEGSMKDEAIDIALDQNNNAIVTGYTWSTNFPTTPRAFDTSINSVGVYNGDIFVFKLNHNGSALNFSTFIGGDRRDEALGITVDSLGNSYITGHTQSTNFSTTPDAYNKTPDFLFEAFMCILAANGSTILYSTYISANNFDMGYDITLDSSGDILLAGITGSSNFPATPGVYSETLNGNNDAFVLKFSVEPRINITSISLFKNTTRTNLIYSKLTPYTFRVNITDTLSLHDLKLVRLILDPLGSNIQLRWTQATNQFSKIFDQNNVINLEPSSKAYNNTWNKWTINFNVTFNWNYPDENFHDVQAYATSIALPTTWLNLTKLYRVENDLIFNGKLSVKGEDNRNISNGALIRGGETLNWTGLMVVYENTTDVYPLENEYNITIWNEGGYAGSDSPYPGTNFSIYTVAASATDIDGDTHIINLSGIPPECDKTNVTFITRIDGDNVTFSNATPDNTTWQTTSNVEVSVNITDIGGSLVNGSSVMYSLSMDNGDTWNDWQTFPGLQSKVSVEPEDIIIFNDGTNNLIKWQAKDTIGNGPVESPEFQILVDTEIIEFSNTSPLSTNVSTTGEVEVGITISDKTSGVNASSIEYKISTDSGKTWTSWTPVSGLSNEKVINITLKLIFPNGTSNRIKWRASDVAGNGPTESGVFIIQVNTWLEKVPIPKVKLWSPPNGSVISSIPLELSWQLLNTKIPDVYYDVYLDIVYPPEKINQSGVINTTVIINDLTNGLTYYWTVLPRTAKINGTCESGVWSFAVNIPIPKVNLISPENNSAINDFQPRLSWGVEYDGTEILSYNVYFGTSEDLELKFENHPSTSCFIRERLVAGETYYWKVEPRAGDYSGPVSETWSFTIKKDYIPHFELELFVSPPIIELPPGDIKRVRAIVKNLGELEDSILLRVEVPPDFGIGAMVDEPSITNAVPNGTAEFYIAVTTSMDPQKDEINLTVVAVSRRATEYELTVEEKVELTVKVLSQEKKDEDEPWLSLSEFWIIFLIIIIILIVLIIVWTFLRHKKRSQETQEETTAEDALTVKPGTVPEAVISVGEAPQTVTQPQLPETTTNIESGQQTQAIVKVPTLANSTAPGQVPETQQIPQVAEVPQLPAAELEKPENTEESAEETTLELDQSMDT